MSAWEFERVERTRDDVTDTLYRATFVDFGRHLSASQVRSVALALSKLPIFSKADGIPGAQYVPNWNG